MAADDRYATPDNVRALLTGEDGLRTIRRRMGLGDTLGALPVESGGTGRTTVEDVRMWLFDFPADDDLLTYLGVRNG